MAAIGQRQRRLCLSGALADGGNGLRFTVQRGGETLPAFAIRFDGQVHAYLNQCAHQAVELDWKEGKFFDRDALSLVCATHGARYHPAIDACIGGRCNGHGLHKLKTVEIDNKICLLEADGIHLIAIDYPLTP